MTTEIQDIGHHEDGHQVETQVRRVESRSRFLEALEPVTAGSRRRRRRAPARSRPPHLGIQECDGSSGVLGSEDRSGAAYRELELRHTRGKLVLRPMTRIPLCRRRRPPTGSPSAS